MWGSQGSNREGDAMEDGVVPQSLIEQLSREGAGASDWKTKGLGEFGGLWGLDYLGNSWEPLTPPPPSQTQPMRRRRSKGSSRCEHCRQEENSKKGGTTYSLVNKGM